MASSAAAAASAMSPARTAQTAATVAAVGSTSATAAQWRARSAAGTGHHAGSLPTRCSRASATLRWMAAARAYDRRSPTACCTRAWEKASRPASGLLDQARQQPVVDGIDQPRALEAGRRAGHGQARTRGR